jgi:catalase
MANFQRDGMMQTAIPKGRANYEPNSLGEAGEDGGPRAEPEHGFRTFAQNGERNDPTEKLRVRAESFADHFSQARMFYRSQTPPEQAHIAAALVFELSKVQLVHVRTRTLAQLRNVDEDLAQRVADGLAMPLPKAEPPAAPVLDLKSSDKLSLMKKFVPTLEGRKVGILFDEGSDLAEIENLRTAVEKAGATAMLIAPKVGGIKVKGGTLAADGQLAGTPSVLLDAIALVLTPEAARKLCGESAAVDFVSDAFVHLKAIGQSAGAQPLLDKAGVVPDEGLTSLDSSFIKAAARRFPMREPSVRILP